jgi:hypothetical protein
MPIRAFPVSSKTSRRHFLQGTTTAAVGALTLALPSHGAVQKEALPQAFSNLKPLGSQVLPITPKEFGKRLQHAQQLMSGAQSPTNQASSALGYDALFLAPGTSCIISPESAGA